MSKPTSAASTSGKSHVVPIMIIGALFFIFGFVTWLNGILIPYLKIACELSDFQAMLVTTFFYIPYFVMGLPSAALLKKTGFHKGMAVGLWVMALGTLIFIPAAMTRTYGLFLTGLFVMGTGLTILQTAVNPYITIIGPRESAAQRISIMGICNKLAGAMAPLILAYFIIKPGDDALIEGLKSLDATARLAQLDLLAARVINPYIVMSIALVFFGFAIKYAPLPEVEMESEEEVDTEKGEVTKTSIWQFPHLILGVITLFFYVGAEVISGDTIIRYGISLGIDLATAKVFTSYTLISMVLAYIIGIVTIPRFISQRSALQWSAILGMAFSLCAIFTSGMTSVFFIAILGFANALVWPAIWPLAIHNLGRFLKTGSAIMIMAIMGGALLPPFWGKLADMVGAQKAYWILIPGYFMIFYYSVWGHKKKNW
jgi:FHS family L-fucose permease-like MFS transporter